jgi:cellulose synthase/poly-beta-1,6-N-acetylglucosamine synthase-like glycosyltransferase
MTLYEFTLKLIYYTDVFIIWYFLWINSIYIILVLLSIPDLYERFKEINSEDIDNILKSDSVPAISIVAPAYNEQENIVTSINAMLHLSYRHIEVVVVNDGSKDDTLNQIIRAFDCYKVPPAIPSYVKTKPVKAYYKSKIYANLLVIDKENGGKADSLNAGINACTSPFFMACDADTLIEKDALKRMIRPVLMRKNTIACGGTIRIVNDCKVENGNVTKVNYPKNYLAAIQAVEYLRAFLFGRLGWNKLGGNLIISGAFGLFNREVVLEAGAYRTDTVGEDMELTVRLHHLMLEKHIPYRIDFIPDPVAWTEVPSSLKVLARQRERWHRGMIDTMIRHRKMLFNFSYGQIGIIAYPFFVFGEMLAPVFEILGYIGIGLGLYFGLINIPFAVLFFLVAWGLMLILTLFSVFMEETSFRKYNHQSDIFKMFAYAVLENVGYRQLTVWYRLQAFWKYFRKDKKWGEMTRTGFNKK